MIIFTIFVMSLPDKFDPSLAAIISVVLATIFVTHSAITRNYALWVGMGRFGARGLAQDELDGSGERVLPTMN